MHVGTSELGTLQLPHILVSSGVFLEGVHVDLLHLHEQSTSAEPPGLRIYDVRINEQSLTLHWPKAFWYQNNALCAHGCDCGNRRLGTRA